MTINMRLLAIHSDKIFFKQDTIEEEVPNFYDWLAEERGVIGKILESRKGEASLLRDIYNSVVSGLLEDELLAYCGKYNEFYFNEQIANELYMLDGNFNILIFTSYPKELYQFLEEKGIIDKIFGAEGCFDEACKIIGLKSITLENKDGVLQEMEKIGFGNNFTLEPNKYGLLELLIEQIILNNLSADDIVVLGKGETAAPMHKIAGLIIERLEEL